MPKKESILITGACGGLACEVSKPLCTDYHLVGIDPRQPLPEHHFLGDLHTCHYRSRKVDELFRQHTFSAVFHLGRIAATSGVGRPERYNQNVLGTQHLLNLCKQHNVPLLVVLSTFHVYGAHPHNPLYLSENDSLRATQRIPQLSDALELDHLASQYALTSRYDTVVLRPTNVVGPGISNTFSQLLRQKRLPTLLGFDPLMQLLHQSDLVAALLTILKKPKKGIYNLAGPGALPLSEIFKKRHIEQIPLPDAIVRLILRPFGFGLKIPAYMLDFFKFSTIIDTTAFQNAYDFEYKISLYDALTNI